MRPFLCSVLKCTSCKSKELLRIIPSEIKRVSLPATILKLEEFKNQEIFLQELIANMTKLGSELVDISPVDLQLFLEDADSSKIIEILYGVDVITGTVNCTECNNTKEIRNGILIYDE